MFASALICAALGMLVPAASASVATAASPAPQDAWSMPYDAATGQVVLFSGFENPRITWTWDGTDWRKQHSTHAPSLRSDMKMVYDAAEGTVVLFGGVDPSDQYLDDTWTWDGADWVQRPGGSVRVFERKAPPGGSILVYEWGFSVGEHVKVSYLDSVHGSTKLATLIANGTGAAAIRVSIPGNATPGTQYIKAKGASTGQMAKATVTVE